LYNRNNIGLLVSTESEPKKLLKIELMMLCTKKSKISIYFVEVLHQIILIF